MPSDLSIMFFFTLKIINYKKVAGPEHYFSLKYLFDGRRFQCFQLF